MCKYPKLKICLAHFGGDNEWKKYLKDSEPSSKNNEESWFDDEKPWSEDKRSWLKIIMDLMRSNSSNNNIYADISYTAHKTNLLPLVKVLINTLGIREKILYGSDFYMVQREETEREFSINLRGYLGEDDFNQIARINPDVFLMQSP